jgi:Ion channel
MTKKQKEGIFRHLTDWSEERKLTLLLTALIFDTLIVYPLVSVVQNMVAIQIINSTIISLILLLGLVALTRRKVNQAVIGAIVLATISVHFLRLIFGVQWLRVWESSLSLVTVIIFVFLLLKYVFKEGPVSRQRVEAAVAAYLMISLAFAASYHLISFLIPGAFAFADEAPNLSDPRFEFNYFSVSTITTLGYGDITPVHPFARALAMTEALVGQLYPAILLARLVSLHIAHSYRSDKKDV